MLNELPSAKRISIGSLTRWPSSPSPKRRSRPSRSRCVGRHFFNEALATGRDMKPSFTIGIEEEYQTIDPVSRDLRSHIDTEIIEKSKIHLHESVKPEM